jgi:hypothetical protein
MKWQITPEEVEKIVGTKWTEDDQAIYDRWVKDQNKAAREQGYTSMDHALEATDYKHRRFGRK